MNQPNFYDPAVLLTNPDIMSDTLREELKHHVMSITVEHPDGTVEVHHPADWK